MFESGMQLRLMKGTPYLTIQGEGCRVGRPAVFVRTAGCDLRCTRDKQRQKFWTCDTPLSLNDYNWKAGEWREELTENAYGIAPEVLAAEMLEKWPAAADIVVTGGEPMLQHDHLSVLLGEMEMRKPPREPLHVTIETNCRCFDEVLANYVTLPSLSPKLQFYSDTEKAALKEWAMHCAHFTKELQVKIVCCDEEDYKQAKDIIAYAERWTEVHGIIQPADGVAKLEELISVVSKDGLLRLIPQVHKTLSIP